MLDRTRRCHRARRARRRRGRARIDGPARAAGRRPRGARGAAAAAAVAASRRGVAIRSTRASRGRRLGRRQLRRGDGTARAQPPVAAGLSRQALMALALELGADVPFFVFGEPALAEASAKCLRRSACRRPGSSCLPRRSRSSTAASFRRARIDTPQPVRENSTSFPRDIGRNDLQAVAVARFPEIAACLEALTGARGRRRRQSVARMTGSGACVFAAFGAEGAAQQVLLPRQRTPVACCSGFVARALNRHPLWAFAAP